MGQKARVSINAQYGWSKMTGDNIEMMNTEQWLNLQEMLDPGKSIRHYISKTEEVLYR